MESGRNLPNVQGSEHIIAKPAEVDTFSKKKRASKLGGFSLCLPKVLKSPPASKRKLGSPKVDPCIAVAEGEESGIESEESSSSRKRISMISSIKRLSGLSRSSPKSMTRILNSKASPKSTVRILSPKSRARKLRMQKYKESKRARQKSQEDVQIQAKHRSKELMGVLGAQVSAPAVVEQEQQEEEAKEGELPYWPGRPSFVKSGLSLISKNEKAKLQKRSSIDETHLKTTAATLQVTSRDHAASLIRLAHLNEEDIQVISTDVTAPMCH